MSAIEPSDPGRKVQVDDAEHHDWCSHKRRQFWKIRVQDCVFLIPTVGRVYDLIIIDAPGWCKEVRQEEVQEQNNILQWFEFLDKTSLLGCAVTLNLSHALLDISIHIDHHI